VENMTQSNRISVAIPSELQKQIDKLQERTGLGTSELVRISLLEKMKDLRKGEQNGTARAS